MSVDTSKSSTEASGLDYEETALTLGIPGAGAGASKSVLAGGSVETERKRGFSETVDLNLGGSTTAMEVRREEDIDRSTDSSEVPVAGAGKPPSAKAQLVGWPPVRSFRRNAMKSCTYVKVAVDGAPYLRKVDLEAYNGYQQLLSALEEMFSCFTLRNFSNEKRLVDPVNGMEYVPTYEDKDGDWMLIGDVPWKMFIASCKRLRLMKISEAVNLGPRARQGCTNAR